LDRLDANAAAIHRLITIGLFVDAASVDDFGPADSRSAAAEHRRDAFCGLANLPAERYGYHVATVKPQPYQ
jgi:hypothetical protein